MKNEARFFKLLEEEKKKAKKNLILLSLNTTIFSILSIILFDEAGTSVNILLGVVFGIVMFILIISIMCLIGSIVWYKDTKNCLEALKWIISVSPIGKITSVYLREDISNIAGKMLYNICDGKKINITILEEEETNNIVFSVEVEGYQNISNTIKYNKAREVEELESFLSLIDWKKTKIKGD